MEISHETNDELKLSVKEELSVLFPHMKLKMMNNSVKNYLKFHLIYWNLLL